MSVGQTARPPAYQVLADDLRAQITSGRLRPGDRLPTEPELCASSGLSRSTVREALRLLASQYLIVTTRGVSGGSFVSRPSPEQLSTSIAGAVRLMRDAATVGVDDLLEVREMLEVPAAALAALRRTEQDLAALRAALFDPRTDDLETMLAGHRAFHAALATAVANPLYLVLTRPLHQLANERDLGATVPAGMWERIDTAHRRLVARIEARDADGAAEVVRAHLRQARDAYRSA